MVLTSFVVKYLVFGYVVVNGRPLSYLVIPVADNPFLFKFLDLVFRKSEDFF